MHMEQVLQAILLKFSLKTKSLYEITMLRLEKKHNNKSFQNK